MPLDNLIRRADRADLAAILALEAGFAAGERMSRRSIARFLAGPADVFVASDEHSVQGAAVILYRRGSMHARIYSLVVDEAGRGQGFGRALLGACLSAARDKGCAFVRLEVRAGNRSAISLYESAGFVQIAIKRGYYPDAEDAIQMQVSLTEREQALS